MSSTQLSLRPSARAFWRVLAGVSVALAVIGTLLPVVPTTPFLLVAAWAAKRGAPELYERLHQHAIWGPTLCDWRDQRAISSRAKILAVVTMSASWSFLWFLNAALPVLVITGVIFVSVGAFVLSRPAPLRVP